MHEAGSITEVSALQFENAAVPMVSQVELVPCSFPNHTEVSAVQPVKALFGRRFKVDGMVMFLREVSP